jgi:hypothetical protein
VLRRSRIIAAAGAGAAVVLTAVATVPAASALPASAAASASAAAGTSTTTRASAAGGIPSGAKGRLASEMLKAWQITKGSGVIVAVLSTHVDSVTGLSGKLITGPDYAPEPGAPATEGTVLASLIAGSGLTSSDPFGTIGRAPGARILALQIVDFGGGHAAARFQRFGTWDVLEAKAIRYAVRHGAKVIVTDESGYPGPSQTYTKLPAAVAYAISRNVVVLGGGYVWGHRANAQQQVPDDLPGVINYSGTVISGLPGPPRKLRSPANYSVVVTAPANVLLATGPGNGIYSAFNSLSSRAWVAGTVALIKSVYPRISPALVARALATSASYHPRRGYTARLGFGLVNPDGALHAAARLRKLRRTARAGGAVQSPSARFGAGPQPVITAVHHSAARLAGYAAPIVVGAVLLLSGLLLARRRRPAAPPPAVPPMPPAAA